MSSFFRRYKHIILYGSGLAVLLFLLKWLEWRLLIFDHAMDIYTGAIAIVFTGLGIWLALKLAKPKVVTVTLPAPEPKSSKAGDLEPAQTEASAHGSKGATPPNQKEIEKLGLSTRELEVLQCMAEGLSNQEIAGRLFVSLNTIKTHSSRIFEKLDVRRRTQAVEKARRLKIITEGIHPKA
jgi:ATP/maltotriose-dependent transcriptional regulator MalT